MLGKMVNFFYLSQLAKKSTQAHNNQNDLFDVFGKLTFWRLASSPSIVSSTQLDTMQPHSIYKPRVENSAQVSSF